MTVHASDVFYVAIVGYLSFAASAAATAITPSVPAQRTLQILTTAGALAAIAARFGLL